MRISRHSVGRWRQGRGARTIGVCRAHFRLQGLSFALSAQLIILGVTGDLAQAEDPPSAKILSACRVPPPGALGEIRKPSLETKKGVTFILAATRFKFTGAYDGAIEQIDQAIKLDPTNPRFYAERGAPPGRQTTN
jgi:TPR repeat